MVTSDRIEYFQIDSEFLDVAVTLDQTGAYKVLELNGLDENGAGPGRLDDGAVADQGVSQDSTRQHPGRIHAPAADRLPRAGEVVIKQGDVGDFFYVVVKGICRVARETPLNKDGVRLAELKMGDTFGEEALISDVKRNATVTMVTDGVLMRLAKNDFRKLLHEPLLEWVDYESAKRIVAIEGGQWVDVRLPSEFENYRAEGAINYSPAFAASEIEGAGPQPALHRLLRYRPPQLGVCIHSCGTRLPRQRAARWAGFDRAGRPALIS